MQYTEKIRLVLSAEQRKNREEKNPQRSRKNDTAAILEKTKVNSIVKGLKMVFAQDVARQKQ